MPNVEELFYEFVSDDRIEVITNLQAKAVRDAMVERLMAQGMVNS
ncbi:hypothetical protein [Roseomonas rosulenta]|nr:hypothetical protein [Roseomonas rosulenta]